ncbi:HNH endonuclease [Metabacillus sp. GX 13764]|uniref:HNH endonuclease signature motif containing protein n=1 Tax=Metabacillus kandeliae TaxID=2900151 RepID=UPI001E43934C|nr:HNH endonuclease signature motif containing protein [Metabacillus kandeliae]MCD7034328.1 HNH endonuclease [Metabacillus kandeliae]
MFGFHPYPKDVQIGKHPRKEPETPKLIVKKPKKSKKPLMMKGRAVPKAKERSKITKKEYNRAIEAFGAACAECQNPAIEMHHLKFRSQGGKGGFRNLLPLCKTHHMKAHKSRRYADSLRAERESIYGKFFWADRFDLFKEGLIPNTTQQAFEKFMEREEHGKKSH